MRVIALLVFGMAALLLAGCAQDAGREGPVSPAPAPPIVPPHQAEIRAWYWLGGRDAEGSWVRVDAPSRYRIEFADARTLLLVADCNRGRADFLWSGDSRLSIGPAGLTKMGCPAGSRERRFVAGLAATTNLHGEGRWLWLRAADGALMLFAADASLVLREYACPGAQGFATAQAADEIALVVDGGARILPALADGRYAGDGQELRIDGRAATLVDAGRRGQACVLVD